MREANDANEANLQLMMTPRATTWLTPDLGTITQFQGCTCFYLYSHPAVPMYAGIP